MRPVAQTVGGRFVGNEREFCYEFLGIKYATAKRFEYATPIKEYGDYDASCFGPACEQYRTYFQDLTIPERRFYHREFREGLDFTYSEDCLNLNIYTPKGANQAPVIVFIHGGGFNSMANCEGYLDGEEMAKRGIVLVTINYRVGVFGYFTHEKIYEQYGRDGNFGLDDQIVALNWVRDNIAGFGGAPGNITVMGQSAGAISIQDLCLTTQAEGLFVRAIMLSGAGAFPSFAQPKPYLATRDYWKDVIANSKVDSFEEFKNNLSSREVLEAVECVKKLRKDNMFNTMPVVDECLLKDTIGKLIKSPMKIPYMVGVTNNDMYTAILAHMAKKYTKATGAYMYFFDVDAPGDDNQAFHSSDLRYVFGTLRKSFRPYDTGDEKISAVMMDYIAAFAAYGDPNEENNRGDAVRPVWKSGKAALCITKKGIKMGRLPWLKLIKNTFKGDPK